MVPSDPQHMRDVMDLRFAQIHCFVLVPPVGGTHEVSNRAQARLGRSREARKAVPYKEVLRSSTDTL